LGYVEKDSFSAVPDMVPVPEFMGKDCPVTADTATGFEGSLN
jgi:hypothetical protein